MPLYIPPQTSSGLTLVAAVATTSGTSNDFTGIPAGVKRITVMFAGVSTNSTSGLQIQIGSGSVSTSGYVSSGGFGSSAGEWAYGTSGFILESTASSVAAALRHGSLILSLSGSNKWVAQFILHNTGINIFSVGGGSSPALGGELDRVRLTTLNGTDTFDAGSWSISYE